MFFKQKNILVVETALHFAVHLKHMDRFLKAFGYLNSVMPVGESYGVFYKPILRFLFS